VIGGDGPCLLVTGGVHGDEFEPMAACRRLIGLLEGLVGRSPGALRGRVVIAPVVNEPAFARGLRTAEDGRDLARTCPGSPDGSITERIAFALSGLIRGSDYYIDLHTGGTRLRVQPLAGYVLHPVAEVLDVQRRMARAFGLPLIWGTDWRLEGRSLSVARDARVPAIYCEYHGGGGCDPAGIAAYVRGCLAVLVELRMLEPAAAEQLMGNDGGASGLAAHGLGPIRPDWEPIIAEDDRPNSGHMQVNLPAPWPGFFEPAVELGQRVLAGQLFGTVFDTLGAARAEVFAPHAGLVIVLHSFARVDANESLGVVLDAQRIA
jgi:predicted deacylase